MIAPSIFEPLLTEAEQFYIKEQQAIERKKQERQWQKDRENKAVKKQKKCLKVGTLRHCVTGKL